MSETEANAALPAAVAEILRERADSVESVSVCFEARPRSVTWAVTFRAPRLAAFATTEKGAA
ncbi:MAG: hypothetical protein H5U20_02540 [Rhodobacteraceae bacterium]|nr:hypothetical protein [Paracoccaceae bacterium]